MLLQPESHPLPALRIEKITVMNLAFISHFAFVFIFSHLCLNRQFIHISKFKRHKRVYRKKLLSILHRHMSMCV